MIGLTKREAAPGPLFLLRGLLLFLCIGQEGHADDIWDGFRGGHAGEAASLAGAVFIDEGWCSGEAEVVHVLPV